MQFVSQGPDIPDQLWQDHEDGKVVFFCGAGISRPAGLPVFSELPSIIRAHVGDRKSAGESNLEDEHRWDCALNYLEKKLGDPYVMRNALTEVLTPKFAGEAAIRTHKSLLRLANARGDDVGCHLVTTNFDRLFEQAKESEGLSIKSYIAPFLPIPKPHSWNGVVYLHGLIRANVTGEDLSDLVVTSGDFGRAYLSERWASRFVSEMLRNYTVCFVGYSLNDPVMRYLVDAVDADYGRDGGKARAYIFVSDDSESLKVAESLHRNESLVQIRYSHLKNHFALHETLSSWADSYRRGVRGKIAPIESCAMATPVAGGDDGTKGRLLWALSDTSGIAAKHFALMQPVPPVEWLDVIADAHFPVSVKTQEDASFVNLRSASPNEDPRSFWIFKWMLRNLNHPVVINYVLENAIPLKSTCKADLLSVLDRIEQLRRNGQATELERVRSESPHGIPDEFTERLWRLIASDRVGTNAPLNERAYDLLSRIEAGADDSLTLMEAGKCFVPVLRVQKSWLRSFDDGSKGLDYKNAEWFSWHLDIGEHDDAYVAKGIYRKLGGSLWKFLPTAERSLCEGLATAIYLEPLAEYRFELSSDLTAIEDHRQNRGLLRNWRIVVDVLRDGWLELEKRDVKSAYDYYQRWMKSEYLTLRRLALFAAKSSLVPQEVWINDLVSAPGGPYGGLLWASPASREVCRLLATIAKDVAAENVEKLVEAIIKGPSVHVYERADWTEDRVAEAVDRSIWLRLEALMESECELPKLAIDRLELLRNKYGWTRTASKQEEFGFWYSGTGDPDFEASRRHVKIPRDVALMCDWLVQDFECNTNEWPEPEDDWGEICKNDPDVALLALRTILRKGVWIADRWHQAIAVWKDGLTNDKAIEILKETTSILDESQFADVVNVICDWIERLARSRSISEGVLEQIADRVLRLPCGKQLLDNPDVFREDSVGTAINHPVGKIVTSLLDVCFPNTIHKGEGILPLYKKVYSRVCTDESIAFRCGRVILASRMVALYYADEQWVRERLMPFFDWDASETEAVSMWDGFLWTNTIHAPLLNDLRKSLFDSIRHLAVFNEERQARLFAFIVAMGVIGTDGYGNDDYAQLLDGANEVGLESAADTLKGFLYRRKDDDGSSDGDDRQSVEQCWLNSVKPFIHAAWPKDKKRMTDKIRQDFALIVVCAGLEMRDAYESLKWAMGPIEGYSFVLHTLNHEHCVDHFPETSLDLVYSSVKKIQWSTHDVREFLDSLAAKDKKYIEDFRYKELKLLVEKREAGGS